MFKKITLKNGLRIILAPQEQSLAATALVLVEAGSKYETKEINGISHFLEHMFFKGTAKRPTALSISSELDGIGAIYNAFTSAEYTGYFAKARSEHLEKILEVLSDIYLNSIFDVKEIEKERGVIMEEINLIEDQPMRRVWDVFLELVYGDQPAGWRVIGSKEAVAKISRDDFIAYRAKNYLPQSTVVAVAGGFDEEKVLAAAEKYFGEAVFGSLAEKGKKPEVVEKQDKPAITLKFKETDQTHLVLGFRAFDAFDERKYALGVMADILGGSASSRLFQKVREEMGAVYYIGAGVDLSSDQGYLAISAGAGNEKTEAALEAIIGELKKITSGPVEEKELKLAKEHIIGNMILGLETSDQLAGFYGEQEIVKKEMKTAREITEKVEKITAGEIQALAKEIFQNEKMNLALIGPFREQEKLEKLLNL